MDTNQIAHILKNNPYTKHCFRGVYAVDQLPTLTKNENQCYVVNTDPSYDTGSHWLAVFYNCREREFFDSFGCPPSFYSKTFDKFLETHGLPWSYNKKRLQGSFSTVCGQYCVYYLIKRCEGKTMKTIVNVFGNDLDKNDEKVNRWFNHNYNSSFPTHDVGLTLAQIAKSFEYRELNGR